MFSKETWIEGEVLARNYMEKQGYKIIYTNLFCAGVELDIVAVLPKRKQLKILKSAYKEKLKNAKSNEIKQNLKRLFANFKKSLQNLLVITEVKARLTNEFGEGLEAVDDAKQKHIIRGAEYLLQKPEFKNMQIRFDVASVDGGKVNYIENAFTL